jgi:hypothetical protein
MWLLIVLLQIVSGTLMFPWGWVFDFLHPLFLGCHWVVSQPCLALRYHQNLCVMFFTQFIVPSKYRIWDFIPCSFIFSGCLFFTGDGDGTLSHWVSNLCIDDQTGHQGRCLMLKVNFCLPCPEVEGRFHLDLDIYLMSAYPVLTTGPGAQWFPNVN